MPLQPVVGAISHSTARLQSLLTLTAPHEAGRAIHPLPRKLSHHRLQMPEARDGWVISLGWDPLSKPCKIAFAKGYSPELPTLSSSWDGHAMQILGLPRDLPKNPLQV